MLLVILHLLSLILTIIMGDTNNDPKGKKTESKVAESVVDWAAVSPQELGKKLKKLEAQMYSHAQNLEFEAAARIRDEIARIKAAGLLN